MPYNPITGASFSGGPYFTTAIAGRPTRNNGGTVMLGGNVQTVYAANQQVPVSNSLGSTYLGYRSGINGSIVPLNPLGEGVTKAISAGTFASMSAGNYIGMRYSNSNIAGISSTLLAGGAGYFNRKSENSFIGLIRTTRYIMGGGWNYTTVQALHRTDATDTVSTETPPTYAIPGRLTYMVTGIKSTTVNYSPKND